VKQIIIELHMRAGISEDAIPSPLQEASSWFDSFFINRTQYAGWHMSTGFGLIAPQQFDTLSCTTSSSTMTFEWRMLFSTPAKRE
jgi:hypothetical protein